MGLIQQQSWITNDPEVFEIENNYTIETTGILGLSRTEWRDAYSSRVAVQVADPASKRKIKVLKNGQEIFSIPADFVISSEIAYCGRYVFLVITSTFFYALYFYLGFNGLSNGRHITGFVQWASPYGVPVEFCNLGLNATFNAPGSATWNFTGNLPSQLNDFPRTGSANFLDSLVQVEYGSGGFTGGNWEEQQVWNQSRQNFLSMISGIVIKQEASTLVMQQDPPYRTHPKWVKDRVIAQSNANTTEPVPSLNAKKSALFEIAFFLEEPDLEDPCDIPITIDPQYRDTGYFCMSHSEYANLMQRMPHATNEMEQTNNLLRSLRRQ